MGRDEPNKKIPVTELSDKELEQASGGTLEADYVVSTGIETFLGVDPYTSE